MTRFAHLALGLALPLTFALACSTGGDGTENRASGVGGSGAIPGTGGDVGTGGFGTGGFGTGGTPGSGATGSGGVVAGTGGSIDFVPLGATCETFGSSPLETVFANEYAAWKTSQLESCGDGVRVKGCSGPDDTCSEAMGYGLLLAVGANDKATFDQLNTYRLQMLQYSHTSGSSLMPWLIWGSAAKKCPPVAEGGDMNSATDADLDAVMALLQAEQRWGGGTYKTQALATLSSIMALEVSGSGASLRLDPGDQENDERDYVAYYTPAYFAVFQEVTGDSKWKDLSDAYYTRLLATQCAANGQIYNDFKYPGECKFWWDSCRVPWRVSLDYAWHQDTRAKQFLDKLEGFVGTDPSAISDQKNSAFAGGAVLSAISNDDGARMQELCNAWANTSGLDDKPYFQKTLRLLYMMVAGGKFVRPI